MLISKYGFGDLLALDHVSLDPSRVAAQIVSGIGFIGGGLIFVRRDAVRGLTTAATVWVAAAVGTAARRGPAAARRRRDRRPLPDHPRLPAAVTGARPASRRPAAAARDLRRRARGAAGRCSPLCTERGFAVAGMTVDREDPADGENGTPSTAAVTLSLLGRIPIQPLTTELAEIPGVRGVRLPEEEEPAD